MVTSMLQSAKMKKRGQINIVINSDEREKNDSLWNREGNYPPIDHAEYRRVMQSFDDYVGLESIKSFVHEIYSWIYINNIRQEKGLKTGQQALHMIFKGNPGTGKTTVARLIATMLRDLNVLEKGHFIEVERADLVGEYIGHTAQKTRNLVEKALGGVLFIDEAYSLARGGEKDFGKEAIDALVKVMEDQQHNFVLILAGYPVEMDRFMRLNPGLPSRFPMVLTFPNYSIEELLKMTKSMAAQRDYVLDDASITYMNELLIIAKEYEHGRFSNGRFIRNLLEKAIRIQAVRLLQEKEYSRDILATLRKADFERAFHNILAES